MTTNKKLELNIPPEFKAEALKLSEKVGVAAAARQLGLHECQLYSWRKTITKDTSNNQQRRIFYRGYDR